MSLIVSVMIGVGGRNLGAVSCKDILSIYLGYLTYMLLNTRFYVALGFTDVEAVAIFMFARDLVYGTGGLA